jgi:hypothetical protein
MLINNMGEKLLSFINDIIWFIGAMVVLAFIGSTFKYLTDGRKEMKREREIQRETMALAHFIAHNTWECPRCGEKVLNEERYCGCGCPRSDILQKQLNKRNIK